MAGGFGTNYLSLGPAKVFLDGSLLGETAAVSEDYCSHGHTDNTGNTGYFQADPEALPHGIETPTRRAGPSPRTPSATAPWTSRSTSSRTARKSTGHGPCPTGSSTPPSPGRTRWRLADAGIAVTPQASFFADGGDGMTASLGPERMDWVYARRRSWLPA